MGNANEGQQELKGTIKSSNPFIGAFDIWLNTIYVCSLTSSSSCIQTKVVHQQIHSAKEKAI